MIELNEFEIPRNKYRMLILFWQPLKQFCWLFAFLVVIGAAYAIFTGVWFLFFFMLLCGLFGGLIGLVMGGQQRIPPSPHLYYQKRKIIFDMDKFHIQTEDGSEIRILLNSIIKVDCYGSFYCLFLDKFYYIPVAISAFRSAEDRKRFETDILGKKLKTRKMLWIQIIIFLLFSACLLGLAFEFRIANRIGGRCCMTEVAAPLLQA